ncbi:DNA/RNA non-specific endonuclease [Streptomyces sp. HSW2009]|uniref:DNA/RNA non-specific endonuclease n=1 Tax=Streptomyces sp. HSW2009 TaxID=3142890 RepID=UPI0032ED4845
MLYTLKDANGTTVGTGTLSVTTSAALSADKTEWEEQIRVTMTQATDLVTTLNVKFRHACTDGCTPVTKLPWTGKKGDLIPGKTVSGTVSYTSAPADRERVDFTTSYRLFVIAPGTTPTDPHASWQNPEKIRCDADPGTPDVGTPKSGCVVAGAMPVIKLSAQRNGPDSPIPSAGAAAASYLWAQDNLADGWGRNKPLTRATANRAERKDRTCGNASSKPFEAWADLGADDSCAQFPFAVASEGGTDGAQCAEIVPHYVSGGWRTYRVAGGTANPCVRAHVPAADLEAAEQQVLAEYASQRVLEDDKFQVEVTTSTAGPQAACLTSETTGARPSGNGWIKNTTEPVPHINKTTDPLGPPGYRPAASQACLGKSLGDGSHAEGDITGWEDAKVTAGGTPAQTGLARCHLIANILGGKGGTTGSGPANLVPCWQHGMNTGTPSMRSYEGIVQKTVPDDNLIGPNDAVFYEVTPMYRQSDSTIPHGVTIKARIERADGTQDPLFPEVYIPNTKGNTGLQNLGN